ncbi:MAG: hypothetical protein M1151_07295 [Candidatus Thermoplasmatota archaeon]|nr:hypothetical protein [Candidatus Thermoplasmatota archaeon]
MAPQRRMILVFVLGEAAAFILYFVFVYLATSGSVANAASIYILYLVFIVLFAGYVSLTDSDLRKSLTDLVASKDMAILMIAVAAWILIFAVFRQDTYQLLLYFPAYLDEINFRFVIQRKLTGYVGKEKAVLAQALAFTLFYSSFTVFEQAGYPWPYNLLDLLDTFSMGILYGIIYYFRRNVYGDIALHLSFLGLSYMAQYMPLSFYWIPYIFSPI